MKRFYMFCVIAFIICVQKSIASVTIVNVQNFQFNPVTFTVNTGDTIMWMWINGTHTTTSTDIPGGAVAWNQPINQSSPMFMYVPGVPGNYDYECTFHQAMGMTGHFTVVNATGINDEQSSATSILLNAINPVNHELQVTYCIPKTTKVNIRIYDIIGKVAGTLVSVSQNAGIYTRTFEIPYLRNGIYFICLETNDAKRSRKIIIQ